MFSLIEESCQRFNLTLNINYIHLDFEERMHEIARDMFQIVGMKSCRIHLGQACKIKNLSLVKEYNEMKLTIVNNDMYKGVRKFII